MVTVTDFRMHSDYFSSNHSQNTDHTFINTANTNRSARKGRILVTYIIILVMT